MTLLDRYTTKRENFLGRILRLESDIVFNNLDFSQTEVFQAGSLAAEIKRALNKIKSLAISDDGQQVDYKKLVQSPEYLAYRELVSHLQGFDFHSLYSPAEALAFWINLYNALVIDAVIQEQVQDSVTESWLGILGFFQKAAYLINGERFSLTDIEHGVLRGNRGFPYFPGPHFGPSDPRLGAIIKNVDPRIHFALNCASKSCPPIGFYSAKNLNNQLDLATRNFLESEVKLDKNRQTISVSRIFSWYKGDFGGTQGVLSFLEKHLDDPKDKNWINNNLNSIRLVFYPYDWSLNNKI